MKEYMIALLMLSVCCAVVELLSEGNEGIGKHIRLMTGICVLCVSIAPIPTWIQRAEAFPSLLEEWLTLHEQSELGDKDYFERRFSQESERIDLSLACETVRDMVCEEFALSAQECRVVLSVDEQGSEITHAYVSLRGQAKWQNTHQIEQYLEKTIGCRSTIYIE